MQHRRRGMLVAQMATDGHVAVGLSVQMEVVGRVQGNRSGEPQPRFLVPLDLRQHQAGVDAGVDRDVGDLGPFGDGEQFLVRGQGRFHVACVNLRHGLPVVGQLEIGVFLEGRFQAGRASDALCSLTRRMPSAAALAAADEEVPNWSRRSSAARSRREKTVNTTTNARDLATADRMAHLVG